VEVSGQFQAPAALLQEKGPLVPARQEGVWAPAVEKKSHHCPYWP